VTASKDHSVRIWRTSAASSARASKAVVKCETVCVGHTDSVESLASNPLGDRIFSGGWDGSLLLWVVPPETSSTSESTAEPPHKRVRSHPASDDTVDLEPSARLPGHSDCVSSIRWPTANLLYSGSWDGTVREWDLGSETSAGSFSSGKAVLSLDVSINSSSIATGHSDHLLRIWDARQRGPAPRMSLQHKAWVSGVAWSPEQPTLLLSACHDGVVRLWDTRSNVPLHEIVAEQGSEAQSLSKVLCVAWDGTEQLVSGGLEGRLQFFRLNQPKEGLPL